MKTEPRRGPGIRGRLGAFALLALGCFMAVAGALAERSYSNRLASDARERSAALLESFSVPCAIAVATDDLEQLDTYLAEVVRGGQSRIHVIHVAMLGSEGEIMAQAFAPGLGTRPKSAIRSQAATRYLKVAHQDHPRWKRLGSEEDMPILQISMPAVSGLRWGTLVAHFDFRPHVALVREARRALIAATALLTLLVIAVLFLGLWRIVVRPVHSLARAARKLQGGDLTARVSLTSTDELGSLARAFNGMAEELQSYTEELEGKVAARTHELENVNSKLSEAVKRLDRLARTDSLTGLHNRAHFMETLEAELLRSGRSGSPLTVLLCDVDFFKRFNDTWGHAAGDVVLQAVAGVLEHGVRATDTVARFGGEEFVVLLIDSEETHGTEIAESLREAISAQACLGPNGETLDQVTMSIGVASCPATANTATGLLSAADKALYAAKDAGRDRVVGSS